MGEVGGANTYVSLWNWPKGQAVGRASGWYQQQCGRQGWCQLLGRVCGVGPRTHVWAGPTSSRVSGRAQPLGRQVRAGLGKDLGDGPSLGGVSPWVVVGRPAVPVDSDFSQGWQNLVCLCGGLVLHLSVVTYLSWGCCILVLSAAVCVDKGLGSC